MDVIVNTTTKEDILMLSRANPTVRVCVDYCERDHLGWGEAMMLAVSELAKENAYLQKELVAMRAIHHGSGNNGTSQQGSSYQGSSYQSKVKQHGPLEKC